LIDYLGIYVPLKNISLIWRRHHCRWRAAKFRPKLGTQGLWAGRDLYRATPAVTRDLGFSGLIRRTAPFSRLLRHPRGCGGSILAGILSGKITFNLVHIIIYRCLFCFCLFVCLFWVARAIFQLSGDCHHCRRQGCKFRPVFSACKRLLAVRVLYCDTGPPFLRSYPKDPWFYLLNVVLLAKEQSLSILNVLGLTQPARSGLELTTYRLLNESTTTRVRQPVYMCIICYYSSRQVMLSVFHISRAEGEGNMKHRQHLSAHITCLEQFYHTSNQYIISLIRICSFSSIFSNIITAIMTS
jgi:hypothetical protein